MKRYTQKQVDCLIASVKLQAESEQRNIYDNRLYKYKQDTNKERVIVQLAQSAADAGARTAEALGVIVRSLEKGW